MVTLFWVTQTTDDIILGDLTNFLVVILVESFLVVIKMHTLIKLHESIYKHEIVSLWYEIALFELKRRSHNTSMRPDALTIRLSVCLQIAFVYIW